MYDSVRAARGQDTLVKSASKVLLWTAKEHFFHTRLVSCLAFKAVVFILPEWQNEVLKQSTALLYTSKSYCQTNEQCGVLTDTNLTKRV